ncbi:putative Sulfur oxidoreductase [Candidatus Hydrogenisulfobacillus filiaventi]|uniref:Putative Sulfur oxidoreductase n=1 Tax=Candidatus Hydrogenisulfobacillus filiaventi TaxID=2707344 RepID=A0A6F8ZFR3_9FIRM|nr:DsrE family protein [Bacillota bacterium]CAB1128302.1 putative Sulfur oxidoreductase [Candidatus Hydrogenisulfobacillus filiaventi]
MATLTILVAAAPEHSEHGRFAFELARAARGRGHRVRIFGIADGVWHARAVPGEGPERPSLTEELAAWLAADGAAELAVCSHSGEERGLDGMQLIPGVVRSSTSQFGSMVAEADRCVCLVP